MDASVRLLYLWRFRNDAVEIASQEIADNLQKLMAQRDALQFLHTKIVSLSIRDYADNPPFQLAHPSAAMQALGLIFNG